MSKLVYLSGPISTTNYVGATDWYTEVADLVSDSIDLLTPMRGKEALAVVKGPIGHFASDDPSTRGDWGAAKILGTRAAITGRDRYDTQRADAVLMNLRGCCGKVSIGCMIEAGWADAARVPIVLCMESGNVHEGHAILEHLATYRVTNLTDACRCLNLLLAAAL